MERIFKFSMNTNSNHIFVVEEGIRLIGDFESQLSRLLNDSARCTGQLNPGTEQTSGVLLLGAIQAIAERSKIRSSTQHASNTKGTPTNEWTLVENEISRLKLQGSDSRCYNVNNHTSGSFAVVYHRSVFASILSWLRHVKV